VTDFLRRAAARLVPARSSGTTGRRTVRTVAFATALLVLAGGSVAVARAHKTVDLDVDGETVQVSTFAGSVAGLLAERGVAVGERDVIAPEPAAALLSGDVVVVRHAAALVVVSAGHETTVWTTELNVEDALEALAARGGGDVRIVASRSHGRTDLPIRLADGSVDVVADGRTRRTDGGRTLAETLASLDIRVGELDRVQVGIAPAGGSAGVTVVVQRVAVTEVTEVVAEPFGTTTEKSAELYTGQRRTLVEGVPGERTTVHRVVTVDGVEESRRVLSDVVTVAPVGAVVAEGTRPRSSGGAIVLGDDVWGALARCESGGNPTIVSSNGLYYGLYQFSLPTWRAVGGVGLPTDASPAEQTLRAQILQARSGWGQWPACAARLGLL
jgi:uncharacterized protein YabE (DUF348 family)